MRRTRSTERSPTRKTGRSPCVLQLVAQRRPHPGEKLVHAERLGYIIVGAEIERLDLAGLVAAARKHDDGHALIAGADGSQQLVSLHVGQAEIENDQIGSLAKQLECGLAVGRLERSHSRAR